MGQVLGHMALKDHQIRSTAVLLILNKGLFCPFKASSRLDQNPNHLKYNELLHFLLNRCLSMPLTTECFRTEFTGTFLQNFVLFHIKCYSYRIAILEIYLFNAKRLVYSSYLLVINYLKENQVKKNEALM